MAPNARVCDPHFHPRDNDKDATRSGSVATSSAPGPTRIESPPTRSTTEALPICRTFGSTVYRGRLAIGDAYLDAKAGGRFSIERRDGVGIDRFSGGASRGVKLEIGVLTHGTFRARIRLENFEDWQLGLLALLCRDLEDEMISIGHATTRGLGRLKGVIERRTLCISSRPSGSSMKVAFTGLDRCSTTTANASSTTTGG